MKALLFSVATLLVTQAFAVDCVFTVETVNPKSSYSVTSNESSIAGLFGFRAWYAANPAAQTQTLSIMDQYGKLTEEVYPLSIKSALAVGVNQNTGNSAYLICTQ